MRLSAERIKELQALLKKFYGLEYTEEQAHEAGMAVMRFVASKTQREREIAKNKENEYGQQHGIRKITS